MKCLSKALQKLLVLSLSLIIWRVWLVVLQALEGSGWGPIANEGGAMAFGQAFNSHKPSQTQNGGALSWLMVARNVHRYVFENLGPIRLE